MQECCVAQMTFLDHSFNKGALTQLRVLGDLFKIPLVANIVLDQLAVLVKVCDAEPNVCSESTDQSLHLGKFHPSSIFFIAPIVHRNLELVKQDLCLQQSTMHFSLPVCPVSLYHLCPKMSFRVKYPAVL